MGVHVAVGCETWTVVVGPQTVDLPHWMFSKLKAESKSRAKLPLLPTLSETCLGRPALSGATIPRFRDLFLFSSRGERLKKSVMTGYREGCKRRLRKDLGGERSGSKGERVGLGLSTSIMTDSSDRRVISSGLLADVDRDELSSELIVIKEAGLERGEGVPDKGWGGEARGDKLGR